MIAVGSGARDKNGKLVPLDVKAGDRILFGKWSGTEVRIDPVKVVRTALQDAASIAGLMITTEATVAEKPKKKNAPAMPGGGGMGGMDF